MRRAMRGAILAAVSLAVFTSPASGQAPVFEPLVDYDTGPSGSYHPASPGSPLLAGRLNSDRLPDIAVGPETGSDWNTFSLLRGLGDGRFRLPVLQFSPIVVGPSVAVADIDGDRNNDILFGTPTGVSVVLRSGHSFEQGVVCTVRRRRKGVDDSGVVVAQLGGRPGPEAVIPFEGHDDQGLIVMRRLAEGGCGNERIPMALIPSGIGGGDLDSDGRTDVVVTARNYWESLVFFGRSDGTLDEEARVVQGPAGATARNRPTLGDLNGDGRDDIIASTQPTQHGETYLSVVLSEPRRTFSAFRLYPTGVVSAHITNLIVGEFTGDGIADVAGLPGGGSPNEGGDRVAIYPGLGDGTLGDRFQYPLPHKPYRLVAGDFNGDGRLDLAARHDETAQGGDLAVLLRAEP